MATVEVPGREFVKVKASDMLEMSWDVLGALELFRGL